VPGHYIPFHPTPAVFSAALAKINRMLGKFRERLGIVVAAAAAAAALMGMTLMGMTLSACTSRSGEVPGVSSGAPSAPQRLESFDPSGYQPLPAQNLGTTAGTSAGTTAASGVGPGEVSLPWRLLQADPESNRIYLSSTIRACNEPVRFRFQENADTIVITVAGMAVPPGALCPEHVTVRTGYLQLPGSIGARKIVAAPVTGQTSR
jgi:hypothetical protein